nr:hypothetical protein [Natronosalvus caseinilyticus]
MDAGQDRVGRVARLAQGDPAGDDEGGDDEWKGVEPSAAEQTGVESPLLEGERAEDEPVVGRGHWFSSA